MKNIAIILLFSIFTISAFSQTTSGNEISAEGSAKTKVKPDLANFRITVIKENLVEKTAIKELNEEIEKLQKILFSLGFTDKNIKIADYQISSSENSDNKKEYSATNSLSINFALDNKLIDAFYQQIQSENMKDLDVTFETQMSEELEKTTRQKLVQMAVLDAKSNAENIAKALDVKISNVKQVSKYNLRDLAVSAMKVDQVKFDKPMLAMAAGAKTSFNKFEVEEKELEETITIVYEIAKK
ncbi:MAG: SIMPL domain-containing protein [Flavobacterium sp.]